ncbi:MAG TPA: hypothetical protein VKJ07_11545, partial [Mycobacteriales bacterium]|nr:hypothetical protein [Mycobacteriales bacterium]
VSYSAVTFTLAPGEAPSRLTLTVAPSSASTPSSTLTVCPLTGSFAPADGGNIADAPPYDCKVTAAAAVSGGQYSFDVSTFSADGTLALAVLPAAASDRVALTKPNGGALQTTRTETALDDSGSASSDTQPLTTGSNASVSDGSPLPVPTFDAPATPPVPAVATAAPATGGVTSRSFDAVPTVASTSGHGGGRPAAPFVFVLLALVAAGLWLGAGRMSSDPIDV